LSTIKKFGDVKQGVENSKLAKISNEAQKRMEDILFDQRVLSFEFDKVLDKQRESFYRQRNRVLNDNDLREETLELIHKEIYRLMLVKYQLGNRAFEEKQARDIAGEIKALVSNEVFNNLLDQKMNELLQGQANSPVDIKDVIFQAMVEYYDYLENTLGKDKMRMTEKTVTLKVLDLLWVKHLEEVIQTQEAVLVLSISRGDFFNDYEIKMSKAYQQMLLSVPRIVVMTLFRTVNKLIINN